jgi:hypothetical protein
MSGADHPVRGLGNPANDLGNSTNDSGKPANDSSNSTTDLAAMQLARSLSRSFALHVGMRALEALSIGWLAGALVAASAAVTMHSGLSVQVWIAAGLCAACAGASSWVQHPPRRDEHVRDADLRLALDGALVTSAGIVSSAHSGSLGAALVRRVAARLQSRELVRASLPRTPLMLLAALAGAAVLFAAQDAGQRRAPSSSTQDGTVAARLESAAQAVRSAALDQQDARENPQSKAALTAIANDLERAARASRIGAGEADRLQRVIESARTTSPSPSIARALEKARSAVESARSAIPRTTGGNDPGAQARGPASSGLEESEASLPGAKGSLPTPGDAGSRATSPDGSSGALASASADGRMSARNADPRESATPRATGSTSAVPERGVGATRWWAPSYDAIVESWLADDASRH